MNEFPTIWQLFMPDPEFLMQTKLDKVCHNFCFDANFCINIVFFYCFPMHCHLWLFSQLEILLQNEDLAPALMAFAGRQSGSLVNH